MNPRKTGVSRRSGRRPGPLELVEALETARVTSRVEQSPGRLAVGRGVMTGPKNATPPTWITGRADVHPDRVHARVVGLPQSVVVGVGVSPVGQGHGHTDVGQGGLDRRPVAVLLPGVEAGADGGVELAQLVRAVLLLHRQRDPDGGPVPVQPRAVGSSRSRPSFSTERLITWKTVVTGRTFSTSSIQREVSQAQGQAGSNQKSTVSLDRGAGSASTESAESLDLDESL